MGKERLVQADIRTGDQRDTIRSLGRIALWTLAWALTLALARFGPELLWDSQPVANWIAIAINLAVGIGLIVAYTRHLQVIDELQRKIMVDAMAVTLGVGLVAGFAYAAVDAAGVITREAEVGLLPTLLSVVYALATVVGIIRYR